MAARPDSMDEAIGLHAPAIAELSAQCIEAIATRVIELLDEHAQHALHPESLVNVGELARRTGLSRTWIYEHSRELGAIRLGGGPRARLRFNPDTVKRLLEREAPQPKAAPPTRRRRPIRPMTTIGLLPIAIKQTPPPSHDRAR